jgi:DNA-binding response OmpR family regulator
MAQIASYIGYIVCQYVFIVSCCTRLHEVFQYLYQREGVGVSHASLIEDVRGWKHTGSNVVEAVVRFLRKKLGDRSLSVETIRGLGYRFRNV